MRCGVLLVMLNLLLLSCSAFNFKHDNVSVAKDTHAIRRVAVLGFEFNRLEKGRIDRGKIERALNAGKIVTDIFVEHLLATGLYQIVGRQHTETLLEQNNLNQANLLALSDWEQIRELLGVDGIVLGVVTEFGDWRSRLNWGGVSIFTARLVDLSSGEVVWSVSANRNMAHVNAAGVTHAGAESAVGKLRDTLRP